MTDQTPIAGAARSRTDVLLERVALYRLSPELLLFDVIQTLFAQEERCPREAMGWILDRALCSLESDGPRASLDDMRGDAGIWADVASPREVEVYFTATLRRLVRDRGRLNGASQKRLFVALWEAMPEDDKRAFLGRVDPDGAFRTS